MATTLTLPQGRYHIRQYRRAKVQKTSYIYLSESRNYYSVPYRYQGLQVEVQYNQVSVEIFYNHTRISSHRRCFTPGYYTTVSDHMSSTHQIFNGWSPQFFEDKAVLVGNNTLFHIQRLLGQYNLPDIAYKQCLGILALGKDYTIQRLEQACHRALEYHKAGYHTVERILKDGLDQLEEQTTELPSIPEHANIRGSAAYR